MSFSKTTPVLRIFDVAKAKEFYVDFLGFKLEWQHRLGDDGPIYLAVSKGACELHLSEHHGDCCPGASVRFATDEVDEFCAQLNATRYKFARPEVNEMPWGSREMTIADPFGNRLTFAQTIPNAAPMPGVTRGG